MKKIFKLMLLLFITSALSVSCDYDENEYDSLFKEYNSTSTYYLQFSDASRSLQSAVDNDGEIIDIVSTIDVVLLGPPQAQDIVVDLQLDPASTIDASQYTLSSTSVTIPAGETSGSVTLTTNTELLPQDENLKLIYNLDAGENTATAGTTLNYDIFRIKFCPIDGDLAQFVGSWSGDSGWGGPDSIVTSLNGDGELQITGVGIAFMTGYWGEVIITQETLPMVVKPNGDFTIPEGDYFTTTYNGAAQPKYRLKGYGRLDACTGAMDLYYDFVQPGVLDSYVGYFGGQENFEVHVLLD
jgi:hypothetical protein